MSVTPSQFDLVSRLLDATSARQRVLGQNVANVNTPGYKRREVRFEDELRTLLASGDQQGIRALKPEVGLTEGLTERTDGNNVDIDMEMGRLTKNALLYETYSQILATQLSMVRSAINGQS